MVATEELIRRIRSLPPEQVQQISDFIDEMDNDVGLEEDIHNADEEYEKWKKTGKSYSLEEVCKEMGI